MSDVVQVEIVVKVWGDKAVVRKVERDGDGRVLAKYGLNQAGQWVRVPEATVYPEECRLPVMVYIEDGLG